MASTTSRQRHEGEGADLASAQTAFHHGAVFYRDGDEFLAGIVPPVREALATDEQVLVALTARNTRRLQAELGDDAERVAFLEMEEFGANPARIIPVWREFVGANVSRDRPALGIGEPIWADRSSDELVECQHHEVLLNVAFRDDPAWTLLCPYDTTSLEDSVLEEAMRSHPVFTLGGEEGASDAFAVGPDGRPFNGPVSDPPADAETIEFGADGVGMLRERVARCAHEAGLSDLRASDLVLAVNELTANSVRHGGGHGELSLWQQGTREQRCSGQHRPEQDRRLVCQVRDAGRIEGPLLGRIRPGADWIGGRGLWMVNQLCDLLQIRTGPEGTLTRVQMRIDTA